MPRRKSYHNNRSRFIDRKIQFQDLPSKTMRVTIHALRWVFLLIFLFIIVGIFILFLTGGDSYFQIILGYSIAGFFTFFTVDAGFAVAFDLERAAKRKKTKQGTVWAEIAAPEITD